MFVAASVVSGCCDVIVRLSAHKKTFMLWFAESNRKLCRKRLKGLVNSTVMFKGF